MIGCCLTLVERLSPRIQYLIELCPEFLTLDLGLTQFPFCYGSLYAACKIVGLLNDLEHRGRIGVPDPIGMDLDQEESNIPCRRDGQEDTSSSLELEVNAMRMAQDMQMMKEKMDMMMNAMRGRVSNNLDELVHRTDSPFTAQVTSFPLLS